jgi:hypothetical protein
MTTPRFRAHIEKRRMHRGHRWFCVTREISAYGDSYGQYGPFRWKRDAKAVKASAKKNYERGERSYV